MKMKILIIIGCVLGVTSSFSLDSNGPILLQPPFDDRNNSLFGYSIVAHGVNLTEQRLLVGAPQAVSPENSTIYSGALYTCDIDESTPVCKRISFSNTQVNFPTNSMDIQVTHNQRLGASLATNGDSVLTCAPNWFYVYKKNLKLNSAPVGRCYYSPDKNFRKFLEFSPVLAKARTSFLSYTNAGYCQGGTSVAFDGSKTDEGIFGAPGCSAWIGDVYNGKPGSKTYRTRGSDYSLYDFSEKRTKSNKKKVDVNERYFGYTITGGKFNNKAAIVSAAPRASIVHEFDAPQSELNMPFGSSLSILVKKSEEELRTWKNLLYPKTLDLLFAYCGFSLASGDVNGDGLDDIVAGCPHFGDDRGAIIIFYQILSGKKYDVVLEDVSTIRRADKDGEMFGTSVAVIEDIDGDGFKEVAVGAPLAYDGHGKVYIYCGTKGVLPNEPCQILKPHESTEKGFGWSIASVSNSLAVSAPQSEYVFVYSKFAVISISLTGEVGEFDMSKTCELAAFESQPAARLPCSTFKLCVEYSIRNKEVPTSERDIKVEVVLDHLTERSRLIFPDHTREREISIRAKPDEVQCETLEVYDRHESEKIVEFLVAAEASYNSDDGIEEKVVLDEREGLTFDGVMRMKIECKGQNTSTCLIDVTVSMMQIGDYVYGISDSVIIEVTISINGDPAYYPKLLLHTYGDLKKSGNVSVYGVEEVCHEFEEDITCSMGGVKIPGSVVYTFRLTPSEDFIDDIEDAKPRFLVGAEFITQSTLVNLETAKATKNVEIGITAKLDLAKISLPDTINLVDFSVPETASELEKRGPRVLHEYTVDNNNNYPVYGVNLTVKWPHKHHSNGDHLLYIGERPKISVTGSQYSEGLCIVKSGGEFDEKQLMNDFQPSNRLPSRKREAEPSGEFSVPSPTDSSMLFTCHINQIPSKETAKVTIISYAVKENFLKVRTVLPYIESSAEATIDHIPFGQLYTERLAATISNNVIYPKQEVVQEYWYWILLMVVIGLIIVFIIAYFIYKAMVKKNKKDVEKAKDGVEGKDELETLSPETDEVPEVEEKPKKQSQV